MWQIHIKKNSQSQLVMDAVCSPDRVSKSYVIVFKLDIFVTILAEITLETNAGSGAYNA